MSPSTPPTDLQPTLARLLAGVSSHLGEAQALELLRHLGGHPTDVDHGAPPEGLSPADPDATVVVVGAGIAGLVLAYELAERGQRVELWEAADRPGGRNFTVRPGDVIEEQGHPSQVCALPEGAYFNAGPGRISHHHRAVLHYCRRFQLRLRPYLTLNRGALLHRWLPEVDRDVVVRHRQVQFDGQGRLAELAAKAGPWLDAESALTAEQTDACCDWLRETCDLQIDGSTGQARYRASGRQGYAKPRGGPAEPGTPQPTLSLEQILGLRLWLEDPHRGPDVIDEQMSMFELEGGTDGLVKALVSRLGDRLHLGRRLTAVRRLPDGGVALEGEEHQDGAVRPLRREAARVVLALQPQAMQGLQLDLPDRVLEGLADLPARFAVKVGGWMQRRFWEEDLAIYGGISFTNLPIQQIWYPNDGFHDPRGGLLVMAYAAFDHGEALGTLAPTLRCRAAVELACRVHPEIREALDPASLLTIAWQNVPHIRSPWVAWTPESYQRWFPLLSTPCGPIAFAGDWCSHLPAWQEGAIRSAYALLPWALSA